jgi:polyphosphate kinase
VGPALERAGCHVVYGLVGLKTHCKTALVVRQEAPAPPLLPHRHRQLQPEDRAPLRGPRAVHRRRGICADLTDLFNCSPATRGRTPTARCSWLRPACAPG